MKIKRKNTPKIHRIYTTNFKVNEIILRTIQNKRNYLAFSYPQHHNNLKTFYPGPSLRQFRPPRCGGLHRRSAYSSKAVNIPLALSHCAILVPLSALSHVAAELVSLFSC